LAQAGGGAEVDGRAQALGRGRYSRRSCCWSISMFS